MKTTFDAAARVLPHIRELHPYVPGEQPQVGGWTKLNTNENPYPPAPAVTAAITAEVAKLRLYPEPTSRELRTAIAASVGLAADNVIIGNGSDNILDLITRCFADDGGVGHTVPSYSLYPVVSAMSGCSLVDVPFGRDMELDVEAIAATGAAVFFLTSPNAPTGVPFAVDTIAQLLDRIDGLLVVDEAYVDFGGESAVPLLADYANLVVVRTFSKAYSLAGMRVGYALSTQSVIAMLNRVRDAYNVDRLAQRAALAAYCDQAYFEQCRQRVIATRERTRAAFDRFGWFTYPSAANFLFTEPRGPNGERGPDVAAALFAHLLSLKVLVRYFPNHPLTCAFLRVSVGTDSEMEAFLEAVGSWQTHAPQK